MRETSRKAKTYLANPVEHESIAGMSRVRQRLLASLCALCAFIVGVLLGVLLEFIRPDPWPGMWGLLFGGIAAFLAFNYANQRLEKRN
jgi:F0F1-type ATP synthase assembly protein I